MLYSDKHQPALLSSFGLGVRLEQTAGILRVTPSSCGRLSDVTGQTGW